MQYSITHTTKYSYSESVPVCHNKVHLAPRNLEHQLCRDFRLMVSPDPSVQSLRLDYFGNQVNYFAIEVAHRTLSVRSKSLVSVAEKRMPKEDRYPRWEDVVVQLNRPKDPLSVQANQFTFASHYAPRMHGLIEYASKSFTKGRSIFDASRDLTRRIFEDYQYDPKATTVSAPVTEVLEKKAGVCQDFAHLQIACLRSLGLAARYVSGYLRTLPPEGKERLVGADMSHAWLSIYCGDLGWVDFDPTNDCIPATEHVTLAWGRDYSDVCPIQGVFIGGGENRMSVSVDVAPIGI